MTLRQDFCLSPLHILRYILLWYILLGRRLIIVDRSGLVCRRSMRLECPWAGVHTIAFLGLWWVYRGAFICHLGLVPPDFISSVCYSLDSTVGKVDLITVTYTADEISSVCYSLDSTVG